MEEAAKVVVEVEKETEVAGKQAKRKRTSIPISKAGMCKHTSNPISTCFKAGMYALLTIDIVDFSNFESRLTASMKPISHPSVTSRGCSVIELSPKDLSSSGAGERKHQEIATYLRSFYARHTVNSRIQVFSAKTNKKFDLNEGLSTFSM